MKTAVLNVAPGKAVKYLGEPCLVLEHRTEGTLLLVLDQIKKAFGSSNNFATSALHDHLNGPYLDTLTRGSPEAVITRTVDLTALNSSKEYGTCECKVAPLTLDELRKYHGILPLPECFEWSVTPWSTPCVDDDNCWVLGLDSNGSLGDGDCTNTHESRPAFLIPSDYTVEDDSNPLEQYSTNELVAEVNRRMNT